MEQIDKRMHALATERIEIEAQLAEGAAASAIAEMGKRLKVIEADLGKLEERWLEVTEKLEAVAV